jgi:hypothetical protein
MVPVLIAKTGVGKTTRIRKFAKVRGLPVKTLLLGSMLEEDVLGLPRVTDVTPANPNGVTRYSLPEWAESSEPFVLFLDELDKARPSVISTVLTVLAEHRIRDHILPKGTIIIGAQQPVSPGEFLADETGQAFAARCCYLGLNTSSSWSYLSDRYQINLDFMPAGETVSAPILPSPSPRQVDWAINAIQYLIQDEHGEAKAEEILSGVLPIQLIRPLIEAVKSTNMLSPVAMVQSAMERPELIDKLIIPELTNLLPQFWLHTNIETLCSVWRKILLEGTNEEIGAGLANQYEQLMAVAEANGGEVEVLGTTTEEEDKAIAEMFNDMLSECGKIWIERYSDKTEEA